MESVFWWLLQMRPAFPEDKSIYLEEAIIIFLQTWVAW
jgi:hypothetical protein